MLPTTLMLEALTLDACDDGIAMDACDDGIAIVKDVTFIDELFVAVSQKPKRVSRGVLTESERLARRREQRRIRRQSPTEKKKDGARRRKRMNNHKALETNWLETELAWRAQIVACLDSQLTQRDVQYLVGALIESDRVIAHCRDKFWPAQLKKTLNEVPHWYALVSQGIQARFYGDVGDSDDEL